MYRPSNRSASWMRNHETSSPFVRTIPNSTPARKYAGSMRSPARATGVTGAAVVTVSPGKEERPQKVAPPPAGPAEGDDRGHGPEVGVGPPPAPPGPPNAPPGPPPPPPQETP